MSLRSKVVIESNLKPSQFGKPATPTGSGDNTEDFEEVYESPLEKSKPLPPRLISGIAMNNNINNNSNNNNNNQELPRNEPEIMEFSNPSKNVNYDRELNTSTEKILTLDKPPQRSNNRNSNNSGHVNEGFDDRNSAEIIRQSVPNSSSFDRSNEKLVDVESLDPARTMTSPSSNNGKNDRLPQPEDKTDISFRTVANIVRNIKALDVNRYATKKTIAQGMLDIALLTANASQLKYILQIGKQHEFYILMLSLICVSIGLQAVVGVLYVIIGGLNINKNRDHRAALIINDLILIAVFLISLINVIISGFGMEHSNGPLREVLHGIICVLLGSSLNINKQQDQKKANVWNNICLILMVLTVAVNAVISAFDMRDTSALTQANTTRGATIAQLPSGGR